MGSFQRIQHRGHLLDGECHRPWPARGDFEFSRDRLTFPYYLRRMAHQRRLNLPTDGIQSDFCDTGVVECRSHHIEQPFDVARGMPMFSTHHLANSSWRAGVQNATGASILLMLARYSANSSTARSAASSDAMCEPRSSRYVLRAATLRTWSGPGGPIRFALLGADATSAASLTLASSTDAGPGRQHQARYCTGRVR
jgi:hypothetical protein